jgi:hypothetical protein
MQDAIEAITRAVASQRSSEELMAAIQGARRAAGFDDEMVDGNDDEDGENSGDENSEHIRLPVPPQQSELGSTASAAASTPIPRASGQGVITSIPIQGDSSPRRGTPGSMHLEGILPDEHLISPDERSVKPPSGRMSPRLTYGLWLEPGGHIRLINPPQDILPYLETPSSLAAVIFWSCFVAGYNGLRALLKGDASRPELLAKARNTFSHSLEFTPGDLILQRLHLRLMFRKLGYVDRDHPGNDGGGAMRLHHAVTQDLSVKGVRLDMFIRVEEVDLFIRRQMGEGYGAVEAAIAGTGQEQHVSAVRCLVKIIAQRSFCFGDGPRWRADLISDIVRAWMREFGYPARPMMEPTQILLPPR